MLFLIRPLCLSKELKMLRFYKYGTYEKNVGLLSIRMIIRYNTDKEVYDSICSCIFTI